MARTQYFVVLHDGKWKIKLGDQHYGPYASQAAAIDIAVNTANKAGLGPRSPSAGTGRGPPISDGMDLWARPVPPEGIELRSCLPAQRIAAQDGVGGRYRHREE